MPLSLINPYVAGCSVADVLNATESMPAVEVIDSRYENFRFDLKSVVADNASSARFVTGGNVETPGSSGYENAGCRRQINGEVVATGAGAAVLGHPAASVAMLANMLAERGEEIPAGTFDMTGGITAAVGVKAGDSVCVRYQDLGSVSMTFV